MVTTLTHPDLVRSLVVVDIAPKDYGDLDRFVHYIEAMRAAAARRADRPRRRRGSGSPRSSPTPGCAASCCRTCAATARPGRGRPTSSCSPGMPPRGTDSQIADFPDTGAAPLRRTGRVARRWRLELRQGRRHRSDARPVPAGPAGRRQRASATGCTARRPRSSPRRCAGCCACCRPAEPCRWQCPPRHTRAMSTPAPDPVARVRATFEAIADDYDQSGVPFFVPTAEGLVEALAPQPGERVLDIGCGRGAATSLLARAVPALRGGGRDRPQPGDGRAHQGPPRRAGLRRARRGHGCRRPRPAAGLLRPRRLVAGAVLPA